MKPVSSLIVAAGAMVVFAAGYAKGAASGSNPFIHVALLPLGPMSFVEGPDADPPPWPSDAPQASAFPPETRRVSPASSKLVAAANAPATGVPASAVYPVSNPPPALQESPPPDIQRMAQTQVLPRRVVAKKEVTFGTTREGRPVTIIWDR
ncbi:MAG: hypothetical protein ACAH83_19635 [Alphaproteobacteria bacterium]